MPRDIHSFSLPEQISVRHVSLNLTIDFDRHVLSGTCLLSIELVSPETRELILDTRALDIESVLISSDDSTYHPTSFRLGASDPILGSPLSVSVEAGTKFVRIAYATSPSASALQWLEPPFLYTQSQAIHARSWIPLQDSPGVRVTYDATIRVPLGIEALMSAARSTTHDLAVFRFVMPQPVPPYLIALAAGRLEFRATGPRTGVWAIPSLITKAADEFADMERMLEAAEQLYGPYRWDRYDVLVLPPAFPFGGMENPRLTFATPTILAGDRSLVSLIAHELAHSWSGNLVTNATWSDFWLNEGFTVYIERRILEVLYGARRAEMEAALGYRELQRELAKLPPAEQLLHINLTGQDPDDGVTPIPYEKGALLLLYLEHLVGRPEFDDWIRGYFDRFAFQSITTATFLDYICNSLLVNKDSSFLDNWIFRPGLPPDAPRPHSDAFEAIDRTRSQWLAGETIETAAWTTHEWLHFLEGLPLSMPAPQLARLDADFALTASTNSEILADWLLIAVRNGFSPTYPRLEEFLCEVGRRKFIRPLYEAMDPEHARAVYRRARPAYHPITQMTIDALLAAPASKQSTRLN